MKLFKNLKTWLASALCATLVLSGVTAVSTLTTNATEGDNASTEVTLSADVQKVLNAFNDLRNSAGGVSTEPGAVEYVKDYVLSDGTSKVSGIKITLDNTKGTKEMEPLIFPNLKLNFGALKVGPSQASAFGYVALSTNKGTADITRLSPHFITADRQNGFAYVMNNNNETSITVAGVRIYSWPGTGNYTYKGYQGSYFHDYPAYSYYATNATRTGYSFSSGYTKPFDIWYDGVTNMVYATCTESNTQKDTTYISGLLSADPTKLLDYNTAGYVNPFYSVDGVEKFSHNCTKAFNSDLVFNGFDNNEGYIGIRYNALVGHTSSFIITSYAGLDLTNPLATFSGDVLAADDTAPVATDSYVIPAPKYVNAINETTQTAFEGTVNVYAGERTYKYSYSALGAAKNNVTEDLGEAIATGKSVGDTIDVSTVGKYTLEYVATNGQKAYSTIIANEGVEVASIDNVNTTITVNGNELTVGTKLAGGDVLKVIPNEGYTVYNFNPNDGENEAFVLNGKVVALNANNEYVVTTADIGVGSFDIISAAYKAKYVLGFGRYDGTFSNQYIYEDIDCKYYRFGNSGAWITGRMKRNGKDVYSFYAVYHYDGKKIFINGPIDGTLPTNGEVKGYTVTKADGTPIGIAKNGLTDVQGFQIYGDTKIAPIVNVSWIETTKIKTKGTKGLQVNLYVNKTAIDAFENGYVKYEKNNEFGYQQCLDGPNIKAVVVKGSAYGALSQIVQTGSGNISARSLDDSYGWSTFSGVEEFKGNMATLELKNRTTVSISDVDYYSYGIVIPYTSLEDFNETYYVGAYLNFGSFNGGDFARLGQKSKTSMIEHGYFNAAINSYFTDGLGSSFRISLEDGGEKYSYSFGDLTYYSNDYQSYEIKAVVSAYIYTYYNKGISLTEVEGYAKHTTKDIWYNTEVLGEGVPDVVIDVIVNTYNAL